MQGCLLRVLRPVPPGARSMHAAGARARVARISLHTHRREHGYIRLRARTKSHQGACIPDRDVARLALSLWIQASECNTVGSANAVIFGAARSRPRELVRAADLTTKKGSTWAAATVAASHGRNHPETWTSHVHEGAADCCSPAGLRADALVGELGERSRSAASDREMRRSRSC